MRLCHQAVYNLVHANGRWCLIAAGIKVTVGLVLHWPCVTDNSVFIDADVSMKAHIAATVRLCFAALRLVRSVRRCLPHQALLTLIMQGPRCQQSRLLLFGAGRCLQSSPWQAPVSSESCSSADFLDATVGSHHSASPRPALVAGPWADTVPICVLAFRCLHGTAPTYFASLRRKPSTNNRCRRPSSPAFSRHPVADGTVPVPPTQRSTLGDRSFPVLAAARSWNRLPASIGNASSVPLSSEESVPFQLLYQLDLLSSVTLAFSSAFQLVLSVSVDHWLCKVPLQRISLSVTLIGTFIVLSGKHLKHTVPSRRTFSLAVPCTDDSYLQSYLSSWSFSFGAIPDTLLARQPFWDRPGIQADRLLVECSLELSFSPGFFSGSIVKAQRGLALCPARYVMRHEARWRSRESRNRTAAWIGAVYVFHVMQCHCGAQVDAFGRHAFVCKNAAGRSIRYHALNELVARALARQQQFPTRRNRRVYVVLTGKGPMDFGSVAERYVESFGTSITVVCPLAGCLVGCQRS